MNYFYIYLQLIYANTFFASQTLKITSLITKGHYERITNYTYAYDLTIALLITYTITSISQLTFKNLSRKKLFLYQIITISSAIIFALLGQVNFLQNFTISGNFWKHLTLREIIVFIIIGVPLLYLTIRDIFDLSKYRRCGNTILSILSLFFIFGLNYILLFINSAKNIHYHIHHAIFAALMALQFNDLTNNLLIIGNGIYMGVLVEGISFYGLSEIYIFMSDSMEPITNISYSLFFTIVLIVFWIFITCLNFKHITKYNLHARETNKVSAHTETSSGASTYSHRWDVSIEDGESSGSSEGNKHDLI